MVSIIIFFVIFSVLVISHEFGHFMIARRNGIRVNQFMLGMGPTIYSKQVGETEFQINLLPVGGACVFDGMDAMFDDRELHEIGGQESSTVCDEHSFPNAPVGARIATVLGGPLANFIVAFVMALIVVGFQGTDLPEIYDIVEDSAAEDAGLQAGDRIRRINGQSIHVYREVQMFSSVNYGEPLDIVYERDGETSEVTLTPRYDESAGRYYIGVLGSGTNVQLSGLNTLRYTFYEIEYWVRATIKSLALIFRGHFSLDDLSGPIGVVQVVDDTYEATKSTGLPNVILTFLNLSTLLSVNLGIMNLLPIPALDGGRLLLLIVEAICGRKLPPDKEGYVTLAGAAALVALMVVVMLNDISKFFR